MQLKGVLVLFKNPKHVKRGIPSIPRSKITDKFSVVVCHCRDSSDFFTAIFFLNNGAAFPPQKSIAGYSRKYSRPLLHAFSAYKNFDMFLAISFIFILQTQEFQRVCVLSDPLVI